jgi:hypothetical protein
LLAALVGQSLGFGWKVHAMLLMEGSRTPEPMECQRASDVVLAAERDDPAVIAGAVARADVVRVNRGHAADKAAHLLHPRDVRWLLARRAFHPLMVDRRAHYAASWR